MGTGPTDPKAVRRLLELRLKRLVRVRDELLAVGDDVPPELDSEINGLLAVLYPADDGAGGDIAPT
ncbi:hypothetical protein [Gemmata sp.]|uniref:hypothetical protein n=1 Tax=Gemmata sp. TaxID=1914242 RepID=UPI003F7070F3